MTPYVTTILNEVEARLSLIRKRNGYDFDITDVERAGLEPLTGQNKINFWSSFLDNETDHYGQDHRTIYLDINAGYRTHNKPFIDIGNSLAANIGIALLRTSDNPNVSDDDNDNLGGLVSNMVFSSLQYQVDELKKPWTGVLMSYELHYYTEKNDFLSKTDI
jgi:hypothetical protein